MSNPPCGQIGPKNMPDPHADGIGEKTLGRIRVQTQVVKFRADINAKKRPFWIEPLTA